MGFLGKMKFDQQKMINQILLQNPNFDPYANGDLLRKITIEEIQENDFTNDPNQTLMMNSHQKQKLEIDWEVEYVPLKEVFSMSNFYKHEDQFIDLKHDADGKVLLFFNHDLLCFDQDFEE
jgi:hypothetical protein